MKWCLQLAALVVAGCSSPQLVDTGRVGIVAADQLPPPTRQDLTGVQRPHLIGPFDELSIDVFGLPELSRQVRADASGKIAVPLAGSIDVAGKTPEEVSQIIEERLRGSYVRNPRVTVSVTETVSQTFAVDGQVQTPGLYPITGNMTLMRAVARAQGTTEFASTSHVVVFRTVEGRRMAALYDLRAIRLAAYPDPEIYPSDVIVVGESAARRIFPQILQASGLLVAPLVAILNNSNN